MRDLVDKQSPSSLSYFMNSSMWWKAGILEGKTSRLEAGLPQAAEELSWCSSVRSPTEFSFTPSARANIIAIELGSSIGFATNHHRVFSLELPNLFHWQ
ncbi:hypothetical protein V6N13_071059 [Hibiscus sabdariffa]